MADRPLIDRFRAWLAERELPLTPQRLAIAEVLLRSTSARSVDEVIAMLGASGMRVGTATVYRAIDVMVEGGFVVESDRGEGFRRFAPARDLPHLEQLLCAVCGRVEEFADAAVERVTDRIATSHGFLRERHRLVIYGTCAACQAAREPQTASRA